MKNIFKSAKNKVSSWFNGKLPKKKPKSSVSKGRAISKYSDKIKISERKMYQQGAHYNKHGRNMGYLNKEMRFMLFCMCDL